MSQSAATANPSSPWLISPAADLCLLVATPLAIVPAAALAGRYLSPEQIFLLVAAFASIGHHLPGFLRAYGDRELFLRFRWRFLLAPPIALAVALAFSSLGLHGLELVLLLWATWHIMMQTYGFMRIYDLKRGQHDAVTARLDWLLCGAVFLGGIVFSQARVFGIAEVLMRMGLPLPSPHWLAALQWIIGVFAAVIVVAFLVNSLRRGLGGLNPIKLLLVLSTAWLYWICGSLTTNLLVGVAMFEVFHALQYYAIVWTYNRRLADRVGARFGPLGFLFRNRWFLLPIYFAIIAAFGSLKLVSEAIHQPQVQMLLLAVLAASTMLHFYYDGFIWKVSQRRTQRNLGIESHGRKESSPSDWSHGFRWAGIAASGCVLLAWELSGIGGRRNDEDRMAATLATWTPQLPELQTRVSQHALARGDTQAAIAAAQKAVDLRPNSHEAHATLGIALLHADQFPQAAEHLQQATQLAPRIWQNHLDLAQALGRMDKWDAAERSFATAAKLQPASAEVQVAWGQMVARRTGSAAALPHFQAALQLNPQSAEAHYQLGAAHVQLNNYPQAQRSLQAAIQLQPNHGLAHFQLGNVYYFTGELDNAERSYRRALKWRADLADAHINLGSVLYQQRDLQAAAAAYGKGLELKPEYGPGHYNLALIMIDQDRLPEARRQIQLAINAGIVPSDDVRQRLGL